MKKIDSKDFVFDGKNMFSGKENTKIKDYYKDDADYETTLSDCHQQMYDLQSMLYAQHQYGVLVIFQAMDAGGKDGTILRVFRGVNPMGLQTVSFKRPSETELNHDFLWRTVLEMPQRGNITIFNRSYYEEVLVVKVHPEILTNAQRLPETCIDENVFSNRYEAIRNYEKYLHQNGFKVIKIFLNISKEEQSKRLIERIEDESKNWKFDTQDIKERGFWSEYMAAYQDMINETASKDAPWYVVPADDKKNMRLIVAKILLENLKKLNLSFPESSPERKAELFALIDQIKEQDKS